MTDPYRELHAAAEMAIARRPLSPAALVQHAPTILALIAERRSSKPMTDTPAPDHVRTIREALTSAQDAVPGSYVLTLASLRNALTALDAVDIESRRLRLAKVAAEARLAEEVAERSRAEDKVFFADKQNASLMDALMCLGYGGTPAGLSPLEFARGVKARLADAEAALRPFAAALPRLREGYPRRASLWPPLELTLGEFEQAAALVGDAS